MASSPRKQRRRTRTPRLGKANLQRVRVVQAAPFCHQLRMRRKRLLPFKKPKLGDWKNSSRPIERPPTRSLRLPDGWPKRTPDWNAYGRSEEHTSELQSPM